MTYQKTRNRLNYLSKEFSETNLNSKEIVSPAFRSKINKNYKEKQDIFLIDSVLALVQPYVMRMVKEEVYQICNSFILKDLCHTCKIEAIISVIILYVWRCRDKTLREERTSLWKQYNLTWKQYSLIVSNILRKTRENTKVI